MVLRQKLFTIFIWLAVINLSTWIGGTLFHMIVVLPIWSQPRVAVTVARENLSMASSLASLSPRYRELVRPLSIVSQQADATHREAAIRLHEEIPGSDLLLLGDTGHYIQFQKTAELVAVIERAVAASSR